MKIPGINELILKNVKKDSYEKYLDLMPDLKSDKNEKIVATILTIVASILLGLFAINPTISTITSLHKQLEDDKFVEARLQEKINNLSILDQKYQKIKKDLPIIYAAIPKTAEIATLEATLQQLSTSDKVELTDLQTLQVELSKQALSQKKFSSYDFSVTTKGNYQDLIDLLDGTINFQRIITVKGISIIKSVGQNILVTEPTANNQFPLDLNLKGSAYFMK